MKTKRPKTFKSAETQIAAVKDLIEQNADLAVIAHRMWRAIRSEEPGAHFYYQDLHEYAAEADEDEEEYVAVDPGFVISGRSLRLAVPVYGGLESDTGKAYAWEHSNKCLRNFIEQLFNVSFAYDYERESSRKVKLWRYLVDELPKIAGVVS